MAKIVISYRRADSEAVTGRIRDRLVSHYGQESIFMDIDSIPFGIDFRDYIKEALAETDAIIAVMGTEWLGKIGSGPPRIMEDTDPVRIEVETALARGIAVIPLLLDDAVMPQPNELPDSLKNLSYRNAAHVDSGRDFHLHMDRLIRSMDRLLGRVQEQRAGAAGEPQGAPQQAPPQFGAPPQPQYPPQQPPYGAGGQSHFGGAFSQGGQQPPPYQQQPQPSRSEPPQITAMVPQKQGGGWVKWVAIVASLLVVAFVGLLVIGLMNPKTTGTQVVQNNPPPNPPVQNNPPPVVVQPPVVPQPPVEPTVVSAPPPKCSDGADVAFQDNFGPPAAGWDETSPSRLFENGEMIIRIGMNRLQTWLYRSLRFKNMSVCAVVKAPLQANKLDGAASGGVVFWATDYQNYYLAQIYLDGSFQVYRRLSNEWIPVVTRTKSQHIKAGIGATNELQVTTQEATGTFYANGQKLIEFRGQPPANGGAVGLHGEAEADRDGEWRFAGITVVDPTAPASKPASAKATRFATTKTDCKGDKEATFADDFKKTDAGWGEMTATAFYADGLVVLKPQPNRTRTMLYRSLRYVNPSVCVNMLFPVDPTEGTDIGAAGIAFWGTNYANFYQASVYRDGTYDIYRYVNEEWVAIKRKTAAPSIKKEPNAVNQLKVQLVNNKATIYINDVKVIDFWGQPPPTGGSVGLFAQADKERTNSWRFTDIVVVD